ncbi:MAG: hypothetical protein JWN04_3777 [Myxococcaceae bacterium]|nr:hypothetical protein [Myxococcaceae bacterium]
MHAHSLGGRSESWYNRKVGGKIRRFAGLCLVLSSAGCTLERADLDAFRDTARGPEKLSAVLHDPSRSGMLRAEAALRLLDLERSDVDGRALLFSGLEQLDEKARRALVPTLERGLTERMQTRDGAVPSATAVRAKDVGVRMLTMLEPPARAALGASLLRWVGRDLDRRADCGEFSLEAITERVGAASAVASADSLRPSVSPASLKRLTAAVDKHADAATRASAAAKVVAVEQAYRASPARAKDLSDYALPALGTFVDTEGARHRLLALAVDSSVDIGQRKLALELTEGHVSAVDVPLLSKLALDESASLELRLTAISRLGETGSHDALPTLVLLAADHTRALRQPAVELAIELGGERGLNEVLNALPQSWKVQYSKDELDAYVEQACKLPHTSALITFMGRKLYAYPWWLNVIAVRYLAKRATIAEATWRFKLHENDTKEVIGEGFGPAWTVGREVKLGLSTLAAR